MPVYKTIKPNKNTTVLVWKIDEELSFLQTVFLSENSTIRISKMKSEIHQKGFLSVRHLLKVLNYSDEDLFYTNDGKPHLKDGKRISITHSFQFSAIIISDNIVGIDMEKNREKIVTISNKFLGNEKEFIGLDIAIYNNEDAPHFVRTPEFLENVIKQLTVIWGAKECLYKIHPDGGLLFKHHLPIEKFKLNHKKTKGWIKKDNFYEIFDIYFEQIEDFTLVYALN